eukprot:90687_1
MVAWEVLSFVPYAIILPICIYGNIVICKYSSSIFIQKRSLLLLNGLNYSFLFGIISSCYFHVSLYYFTHSNSQIHILVTMYYYLLSWWSILFFLLTKNWLIYWRYKWTRRVLQNQWQTLINGKQTFNFYIANNHKYGKTSYVSKIAALGIAFEAICFIAFLISTLTKQAILELISGSISMIFALIAMIIYGIIICKIPSYNDTFHIHWESKLHGKLVFGLTIAMTVFLVIDMIIGMDRYLVGGLLFPLTSVVLCIMSCVSTFGVLNKNKAIIQHTNDTQFAYGCTVEAVLSDPQVLNVFMNHLAKEFSMECLLFYIELCQYERYLIQTNSDHSIKRVSVNRVRLIEFPSYIPASAIVQCREYETVETAMKIKAHKLYKKYIESGTELEVNMSFDLRFRFSNLMNNLPQFLSYKVKTNDMLLLFDKAKAEMKTLMFYALNRFQATKEFGLVQDLFQKGIPIHFVHVEDRSRTATHKNMIAGAVGPESPSTPLVGIKDNDTHHHLMNTKIFLPKLDETNSEHFQFREIELRHQNERIEKDDKSSE